MPFPFLTKMGGMAFGSPDVCKVPMPPQPAPVPTPFPNFGQLVTALKTSLFVKILNMPLLTSGSVVPLSQGDELGVGGGIVSGVNMNQVGFTTASPVVYVEGDNAATWMSQTAHNGTNANMPMGSAIVPSQTIVLTNVPPAPPAPPIAPA